MACTTQNLRITCIDVNRCIGVLPSRLIHSRYAMQISEAVPNSCSFTLHLIPSLLQLSLMTGVQAAAAKSSYPAVSSSNYSYTNALHKTLLFIETMRSGKLPRYRVAWCAILSSFKTYTNSTYAHACNTSRMIHFSYCILSRRTFASGVRPMLGMVHSIEIET